MRAARARRARPAGRAGPAARGRAPGRRASPSRLIHTNFKPSSRRRRDVVEEARRHVHVLRRDPRSSARRSAPSARAPACRTGSPRRDDHVDRHAQLPLGRNDQLAVGVREDGEVPAAAPELRERIGHLAERRPVRQRVRQRARLALRNRQVVSVASRLSVARAPPRSCGTPRPRTPARAGDSGASSVGARSAPKRHSSTRGCRLPVDQPAVEVEVAQRDMAVSLLLARGRGSPFAWPTDPCRRRDLRGGHRERGTRPETACRRGTTGTEGTTRASLRRGARRRGRRLERGRPVSSRVVYRGVGEESVYVAERARGRGVGRTLLASADRRAPATEASGRCRRDLPGERGELALHRSLGFREVGVRERIGQLDGAWRDVVLLELRL